MKRKIAALCILFMYLLSTALLSASAASAKAPTRIPAICEKVMVYTLAEPENTVDLSALIFSSMDANGTENRLVGAGGLENISKIWVDTGDQEPFSAYCIDFSRLYPAPQLAPDNFVTAEWPAAAAYDRMLWVIEHSYPALPMEVMLQDAGIDYAALRSAFDSDAHMEAVIYGIIQHAVWYWHPTNIGDGVYYGPTLLNGNANLQKLFAYFTQPRTEHENYRSKTFSPTLVIKRNGNAEGIKAGDAYQYGPFHVDSGFLSAGNIQLAATSEDGFTVSIQDADGQPLTTVRQGQQFYITVSGITKSEFTVNIQAKTTNGLIIVGDNRGRIYTHLYDDLTGPVQPVGTGGVSQPAQAQDTVALSLTADYTPPEAEPTPEPKPEPTPEPTPEQKPKPTSEPTPPPVKPPVIIKPTKPLPPLAIPTTVPQIPQAQVPENTVINPPKTGDAPRMVWVGLLLIAAACVGACCAARCRSRKYAERP